MNSPISRRLQKLLGYDAKEIELCFKEESNRRRSEIYDVYQSYVKKQLIFGKEKTQLPPEFKKARLAYQEQQQLKENEAADADRNKTDMQV